MMHDYICTFVCAAIMRNNDSVSAAITLTIECT